MNYFGEIAAIATAVCWAITSTAFEDAGKRIGSVNLNLLRLLIGFVFLSIYTWISRGMILPLDASKEAWGWLMLSGLVGIVIGDLLLFEAFVKIGARVSMLIYSSVPPITGIIAYIFLGDVMNLPQIIGMCITLIGIGLVIFDRSGQGKDISEKSKVRLKHPVLGVLLAFGGAVGQAAGYIIGKYGMADFDAFASTQIRLIAGILAFVILFTIKGYWVSFFSVFKKMSALKSSVVGAFFGPFIGISLSLYAVQNMNPGVASTIIAITPVLLIPHAIFVKKEKIQLIEIVGSFVAISGIGIMYL